MKFALLHAPVLAFAVIVAGCAPTGEAVIGADQAAAPEASDAAFAAAPDSSGSGRYPAIRDVRADLPDHIVITGFSVAKEELRNIHSPVLYILGGEGDVAYPNGMDDFGRIDHVPVAVANLEVGHGGTFREVNGGRVGTVAVQWLEWQLRGDESASRWFVGESCGLCEDAEWTYEAKGF